MHILTCTLLVLTLLLCGSYTGMALMSQIGILPAMRRLSLPAYADAFRAMDAYMDRAMPPYKLTLLLVNLAACISLALLHRKALAVMASLSFLLNLLALILTIRKQLPLNAQLKNLPAGAADETLLHIRERTVRNFTERFIVSALAFGVLCVGVVFWPLP